jgi:hypothetical protein
MMTNGEHEVIHEDLAEAGWRLEDGKQGFGNVSEKWIRVTDGWSIAKLVDPRGLGLIGDRVQRAHRQVEVNGMERAVEVEGGLSLYVVDDGFAWAHGRNRGRFAVLPIFVALE